MAFQSDNYWLSVAHDLALIPKSVKRNPRVGCVIIDSSGLPVAKGFHEGYGTRHAEQVALEKSGSRAKNSTLFVTLEPCNHVGKTPSCCNAIVESGIKRVVFSRKDPNPITSNNISFLKQNGIEVIQLNASNKYSKINYRWLKSYELERPYLTAKIAISIDGKINDGKKKNLRLTGIESEHEVHEIRNGNDAIITGAQSVLADNSKLTVRYPKKLKKEFQPIRYVVGDTKIPDSFNIFKNDAETFILPRLNPRLVLDELWKNDVRTALLETGPGLLAKYLEYKLVDELIIYMAPIILGQGNDFLKENIPGLRDQNWRIANVGLVGRDLRLHLLIN